MNILLAFKAEPDAGMLAEKEWQAAERLINACPAGLFSLTPEGNLRIDYRSCLECGTCRLLCDESTLQQWRYPPSGFGITYRFG